MYFNRLQLPHPQTRRAAKLAGPETLSTVLAVLEPTEEERTGGSWTWYSSRTAAKDLQ